MEIDSLVLKNVPEVYVGDHPEMVDQGKEVIPETRSLRERMLDDFSRDSGYPPYVFDEFDARFNKGTYYEALRVYNVRTQT